MNIYIYIFGVIICILTLFLYFFYKNKDKRSFEDQIKHTIDTFVENVVTYTDEDYFVFAELYHYGKFGKQKNLVLAIENYNKCIVNTRNNELKGLCHLGVAKIYEERHPVNVDLLIDHYLKALECGFEESILHIGKLYLHGIHPSVLPDKMQAARVFSTFLNFSPTLHPWCKLYLQDIYDMSYSDLDATKQPGVAYQPLPFNITNIIHHFTTKITQVIPYKTKFNEALLVQHDDEDDLENVLETALITKVPRQRITNDTQNVHDHSLQNIGNTIIDILDKNPEKQTNFHKNLNDLYTGLDENKYPNVKRVCSSYGDMIHSRYDKSEQEVFNLVWSRVRDNPDLTAMFVDNIDSSVENDHVVCSTGKIMRMLSTLDAVDDNTPDLKPEWAIKDEIAQTIAKVLNDLSPKERTDYESEDNNDTIKLIIKQRVQNKCQKDYANVLDPKVLDIYLKDYFEHI